MTKDMNVMESGTPCVADPRAAVLPGFSDYHRNEGHCEASISAYLVDIRDFLAVCHKALEAIDDRDIDAVQTAWRARGLSPRTINRRLAAVSSLFYYLRKIRVRADNPVDLASRPAIPRRLPRDIPTQAETLAMCQVPGLPGAVCEILYGTAARRAELAVAKKVNYEPESGTIRIVGKGNKEALLVLTEPAKLRLHEIMVPASEWLISRLDGSPLGRNGIYEAVVEARKAAGVTKCVTPHRLRAACLTHMVENGASLLDAQTKARHESPVTTSIYVDYVMTQLRAAQSRYHPAERRKG